MLGDVKKERVELMVWIESVGEAGREEKEKEKVGEAGEEQWCLAR